MEKKSKLVLAVLQGSDSDNTIRNLNERGFMVTVLSSTGGFLKKKSTTVMIGVRRIGWKRPWTSCRSMRDTGRRPCTRA